MARSGILTRSTFRWRHKAIPKDLGITRAERHACSSRLSCTGPKKITSTRETTTTPVDGNARHPATIDRQRDSAIRRQIEKDTMRPYDRAESCRSVLREAVRWRRYAVIKVAAGNDTEMKRRKIPIAEWTKPCMQLAKRGRKELAHGGGVALAELPVAALDPSCEGSRGMMDASICVCHLCQHREASHWQVADRPRRSRKRPAKRRWRSS